MARLPRVVLQGHLHLVVSHGHNGQPVFLDPMDRDCYLAALREAATEAGVAIHAYGLIDNEARLLVTPSTGPGLAAMIQGTGRRFVRNFNRAHGRSGSPWDGRFRSAVVEAQRHFFDCLRFVELAAPLGPGAEPGGLAWSSSRHHAGRERSPLITEHPVYWSLGNTPFEREVAYRRLAEGAPLPDSLASSLHAALNGWVLGSEEFASNVETLTGRRTRRHPAGRPKVGAPKRLALTPIESANLD